MAKIKNGRSQELLQQSWQHLQSIHKNIQKFKQQPYEEKIREWNNSPQRYLEKRNKRVEQKSYFQKKIMLQYNKGFYPDIPNLQFPNQLLDCLVKVICSFGNSAKHNQIIKNLSLYYTDEVKEEVVDFILAESEKSGTIYELDGKLKVTYTLIQVSQLQNKDQNGQQMKNEDIDENDKNQIPSLANNHIQSDQNNEEDLNLFRKHN